jgi:AraC-like DNA-binding protein
MFFSPPWGVRVPNGPGLSFILVGRGTCTIEAHGGREPIVLCSGDVALVSGAFEMHDGTRQKLIPLAEIKAKLASPCPGGGTEPTQGATWLLVSNFTFEGPLADSVTSMLGSVCHVRSDEDESTLWLQSIFRLISHEACLQRPGSEFAYSRIMELYFVQFLRAAMKRHLASGKSCSHAFLRVLFDPHLSKAVEMIHRHPERNWSVAELAAEVSMSRTAFAVRFSEVAGIPPLAYVTRWRMMQATEYLEDGLTLQDVAPRVGYESEAAFARAFKREFGVSPGIYRRSRLARAS